MDDGAPQTTPYRLKAAGETHQGLRDHNEDTVLCRHDLHLYLLADGAGGENAGNVASALSTTAIAHFMERTQAEAAAQPAFDALGLSNAARRLATAVQHANREIVELARSSERYRGMGTTVVAVFVEPERGVLHLAHVGDSRCYRVRDGRLDQLTQDHSLANDVLEVRPDLSPEEIDKLPRNVITRALGMAPDVRVSVRSVALAPGDRYLLCSDGLSNELDDEQLLDALSQPNKPEAQAKLLLDIANARGASDNVAVLVVDCTLPPGAPAPFAVLRPPPRPRPLADEPSEPEREDPEIIVLEGDEATDPAARPSVRAVPEAPLRESSVDVVQQVVLRIPPPTRIGQRAGDREPTMPFDRRCRKCGALFQGTSDACPNCWEA